MKTHLFLLISTLCSFFATAKEAIQFKNAQFHFLENNGQIKNEFGQKRKDIDYVFKTNGVNAFISAGKIYYQFNKTEAITSTDQKTEDLHHRTDMYTMSMEFIGANENVRPVAQQKKNYPTYFYQLTPKPGINKYTNESMIVAYSYDRVTYSNIYPGIDWVVYMKDGNMEYDFVIHPGADPNKIKLKYNGATTIVLNQDGSVSATTPMGNVLQHAPFTYQLDGKKIGSAFKLNNNELSFEVQSYIGTLIIDPVLSWSTYHGVAGNELYKTLKLDGLGNLYVAGETTSTANLVTDATIYSGGSYDGFISKFDTSGNLVWTTYWGTDEEDYLPSLTLNGSGHVYIAGYMLGTNFGDATDAYVAQLSTNGILLNSYYWESDFFESIYAQTIVCDNYGNVIVGGETSQDANLVTSGAYKTVMTGSTDGLITKFDANLDILWSSYFGGNSNDWITQLEIDKGDNLYIGGYTRSSDMSTSGQTLGGIGDDFVSKFNILQEELIWGTYIGGDDIDVVPSITIDTIGQGAVYISGPMSSVNNISTPGAYQTSIAGSGDIFLIKLDTAGNKQWGTYFGGTGNDAGKSISVDLSGVYITGRTYSTNLPTINSIQGIFGGGQYDGCFVKFSKSGSLIWSTYFGGSAYDDPEGIETDKDGNIYFCGTTSSSGLSFNTTFQPNLASTFDAFLGKISDCSALDPLGNIIGNQTICLGDTKKFYVPEVLNASYSWTFTGGIIGNSTLDSISITATSLGTATISVVAVGYCDTTSLQTLTVTVVPIPTPTITVSGNQLGTGIYLSYQWNLNGNPIPGATSQQYTPTDPGDYTVTITDANGCSATSALQTVSVENINIRHDTITVIPNPNGGEFTISGQLLTMDNSIKIEIIDVTGKSVYSSIENAPSGIFSKSIDVKMITPGNYYIKLHTDSEHKIIKFIKAI